MTVYRACDAIELEHPTERAKLARPYPIERKYAGGVTMTAYRVCDVAKLGSESPLLMLVTLYSPETKM